MDGSYFCADLQLILCFFAVHAVILRTRNTVYSEDVKMNLAVNRLQKNVWSWSLIAGSLLIPERIFG